MGNKFSKSIVQRQEQEAQLQKKESPAPTVAKAAAPKTSSTSKNPDLSGYLSKESRRAAKNKSFYLDEEVIDAVRLSAQRQGVTESRLVNEILRRVLEV